MQIAIVHYHLNRGGVARVIDNHLHALSAAWTFPRPLQVALVHCGSKQGWPEDLPAALPNIRLKECPVAGLAYDTPEHPCPSAMELADAIETALRQVGFSPRSTVLHVHNHNLGKNAALPPALRELAARGFRLLLQIHDFAEDFRPANYAYLRERLAPQAPDALPCLLYPQAAHIHYAVLNMRDRGVLAEAGVAEDRLHSLPNPVTAPDRLPDRGEARACLARSAGIRFDRPFLVYPVRAIRRKNLGEAVLWAALLRDRLTMGNTLPPLNPLEVPQYQKWRQLALALDLPMHFELGKLEGVTFPQVVAAADAVVTTSVAEGFGMVFLEAWLMERCLLGRDLPEITSEFREAGIRLDRLYQRLNIPLALLDEARFRQDLLDAYNLAALDYNRELLGPQDLDAAMPHLVRNGCVDFGQCGPAVQRQIVRRCVNAPPAAEAVLEHNPALREIGPRLAESCAALIQENKQRIAEVFGLAQSGRRLLNTYERLMASPIETVIASPAHPEVVLDRFFRLERLHPVRFADD